jgi:hypothetical protein
MHVVIVAVTTIVPVPQGVKSAKGNSILHSTVLVQVLPCRVQQTVHHGNQGLVLFIVFFVVTSLRRKDNCVGGRCQASRVLLGSFQNAYEVGAGNTLA